MRRLITNQSYSKPLWIELFEKMYNTNITKFTNFGTFYPVILKKRSNNLFWKNTFDAWIKISNKQEIKNGADLLISPLWYNREMSYQEMYLPTWYKKGIVTVVDVIFVICYLGFNVAFNTVQVISRRVVGRAEETST